jgi:DNA-binding response OmpR family regulator
MIWIHRSKPVVRLGRREIRLTRAEHLLITTLGMMNDKVVSNHLLIETALENPVKIPADQSVLHQRVSRLRKKIGPGRLQKRPRGYILTGEVYFFGESP